MMVWYALCIQLVIYDKNTFYLAKIYGYIFGKWCEWSHRSMVQNQVFIIVEKVELNVAKISEISEKPLKWTKIKFIEE